jgi:hypothetical protein
MFRGLWIFCLLVLLAGCASLRFGAPPRVDQLASLTPGVSTKADLLLALGEPRGYGVVRFSPDLPPAKVWFYEYVESDGRDVSLKILIVYLGKSEDDAHPEKYEGHLWFASANRLNMEYTGEEEGKR